jgi:hypothetical protein
MLTGAHIRAVYKCALCALHYEAQLHGAEHYSRGHKQVRGSLRSFVNRLIFHGQALLASSPTPKLEDRPL